MTAQTLQTLITNGENSGVEFKRDDIRPEQLAKEIVALANLKGGHILLGIEDNGNITGITRPNLSEWVADTVFGRYIHPMILPYYEEVQLEDGKRVAVITIGKEVSKPYVVRHNDTETAYVRIGSVSRQATREQLLMLGAASGFIHTEIMPVNRTNFESLDKARLENYLQDILNDPEVPTSREEWIERLKALGFMTEGVTEEAVCTIAGIAHFGIRPRQWLYPIEAIRELMINSLVHRDWSRFVDVEITGYNNRLEIISPGSLPNSMTIEKMLAGQRSARNNLIVEVMRDYGYVDARGMGVRTKVLPALKKSGNDQKFSATDDFVQFSLFLKGQRSTEDAPLNKKEHEASGIKGQNAPLSGQYDLLNDLLNQIIGQPEADYQTLAQALNVSEATVKRHIQKLKQMNRLQRKGSKKTGHWEVIEP